MSLHDKIMNLPAPFAHTATHLELTAYKYGHRDARHAAAELAIAYDQRIDLLEAALKTVCDASQSVANVAYNLGQAHNSWGDISKDISALDRARREGYSVLRELETP